MTRKLKVLRAMKEVKQEEVAEMLGITLTTYSKKENGKSDFTISEAKKLATFFDCTIEEIFFDEKVNF